MRAINLDRDWRFREGTYWQGLNESDFGKKAKGPKLWDAENPYLYQVTVEAERPPGRTDLPVHLPRRQFY